MLLLLLLLFSFSELDQHMIDWNNVLSCMAKFAASFNNEHIQFMPHMCMSPLIINGV